jgi:hypothetical protein
MEVSLRDKKGNTLLVLLSCPSVWNLDLSCVEPKERAVNQCKINLSMPSGVTVTMA